MSDERALPARYSDCNPTAATCGRGTSLTKGDCIAAEISPCAAAIKNRGGLVEMTKKSGSALDRKERSDGIAIVRRRRNRVNDR